VRKAVTHVGAWLVWLVVLWGFWMLLVDEWTAVEIIAATCVAVPVAAVAELARAKNIGAVRVPLRYLRQAATVPFTIVADFGVVTWVLIRALARGQRIEGSFRVKPFAPQGTAAEAPGIRAWTALVATYSPNAYVIDIDADEGTVLLHHLVQLDMSEAPA
jgi:multisubunit Na+/H+ antiporter MnhE subunit